GPLTVGNGLGSPQAAGQGADRVTIGNATQQIGNSVAVTVDAAGELNLGSVAEQMGAVTLNTGLTSSALVTGGTLNLNGNLAGAASPAGLGSSALISSPPATVSSNVTLGGATVRRVVT